MPSEALWRRAAFEMQSPLASAMRISPFSTLSVPSTAMIFYAAIYLTIALGALEQLRRSCPGRHRASHGVAFFGAKTQRYRRFARSAPARGVFHGEQSGGD